MGVEEHSGPVRRRVLAGVGLALVATVVLVIVTNPFGGPGKATASVADNASAISLTSVKRQSLSQQTQVSGTLGYAGSSSIRVPSGMAPSAVQQAAQQVTSAETMLASARATLASDTQALAGHQAMLVAVRAKEEVDCAGEGAAEATSASSSPGSEDDSQGAGGSPCSSDVQAVSQAQQNATGATAKVTADRSQVSSAEKQLASAQSNLSTARSSAALYGQGSTFTALPSVGQIISRGQSLYEIGGQPVLLLYGSVAPTRAFVAGMSPGSGCRGAEREPAGARLRAGSRRRRIHHRYRGRDSRRCNPPTVPLSPASCCWGRSCSIPGRCASRALPRRSARRSCPARCSPSPRPPARSSSRSTPPSRGASRSATRSRSRFRTTRPHRGGSPTYRASPPRRPALATPAKKKALPPSKSTPPPPTRAATGHLDQAPVNVVDHHRTR